MRVLMLAMLLASCVDEAYPEERPYPVGMTHTTLAEVPHTAPGLSPSLRVSGDLVRRCALKFRDVEIAPSFWFDHSALDPVDQDVLAQLARCVTTGPLAGQPLRLATGPEPAPAPPSENEHELAPAQKRTGAAGRYLIQVGVAPTKLSYAQVTAGADAGVTRDGRVDIDVAR
jgi:hypothetical protein